MSGSHIIAQTSKFVLIDIFSRDIVSRSQKVMQCISPDIYFLVHMFICPIQHQRFWCEKHKSLWWWRKWTENIKLRSLG